MPDEIDILDEALQAGFKELAHLADGQVEQAELLADQRGTLMEQAWRMRDPRKISALKHKLLMLQSLQGQISTEAKRLHAAIKRDLLRAKQENQRLTGYRSSLKPVAPGSRFIDKVG
jgi:hypothetical protein